MLKKIVILILIFSSLLLINNTFAEFWDIQTSYNVGDKLNCW